MDAAQPCTTNTNNMHPRLASGAATPIAQLSPDLEDAPARVVRGEVTITWPFNSVRRSVAFLVAEPDVRLRAAKGQIRVHLDGPSAKAIVASGLGAGDEVLLSLEGAQWAKDATPARVPGSCSDWELRYSQKLLAQVTLGFSEETKTIDVDNPPPSPIEDVAISDAPPLAEAEESSADTPLAPDTPVNSRVLDITDNNGEYASPAFIKRARISYGSLFEDGFDVFEDDGGVKGKGRKRARVGRYSSAWRYTSNSPSPEPEPDEGSEEGPTEQNGAGVAQAPSSTPARPQMMDEGCQVVEAELTPSKPAAVEARPTTPASPAPPAKASLDERTGPAEHLMQTEPPSQAPPPTEHQPLPPGAHQGLPQMEHPTLPLPPVMSSFGGTFASSQGDYSTPRFQTNGVASPFVPNGPSIADQVRFGFHHSPPALVASNAAPPMDISHVPEVHLEDPSHAGAPYAEQQLPAPPSGEVQQAGYGTAPGSTFPSQAPAPAPSHQVETATQVQHIPLWDINNSRVMDPNHVDAQLNIDPALMGEGPAQETETYGGDARSGLPREVDDYGYNNRRYQNEAEAKMVTEVIDLTDDAAESSSADGYADEEEAEYEKEAANEAGDDYDMRGYADVDDDEGEGYDGEHEHGEAEIFEGGGSYQSANEEDEEDDEDVDEGMDQERVAEIAGTTDEEEGMDEDEGDDDEEGDDEGEGYDEEEDYDEDEEEYEEEYASHPPPSHFQASQYSAMRAPPPQSGPIVIDLISDSEDDAEPAPPVRQQPSAGYPAPSNPAVQAGQRPAAEPRGNLGSSSPREESPSYEVQSNEDDLAGDDEIDESDDVEEEDEENDEPGLDESDVDASGESDGEEDLGRQPSPDLGQSSQTAPPPQSSDESPREVVHEASSAVVPERDALDAEPPARADEADEAQQGDINTFVNEDSNAREPTSLTRGEADEPPMMSGALLKAVNQEVEMKDVVDDEDVAEDTAPKEAEATDKEQQDIPNINGADDGPSAESQRLSLAPEEQPLAEKAQIAAAGQMAPTSPPLTQVVETEVVETQILDEEEEDVEGQVAARFAQQVLQAGDAYHLPTPHDTQITTQIEIEEETQLEVTTTVSSTQQSTTAVQTSQTRYHKIFAIDDDPAVESSGDAEEAEVEEIMENEEVRLQESSVYDEMEEDEELRADESSGCDEVDGDGQDADVEGQSSSPAPDVGVQETGETASTAQKTDVVILDEPALDSATITRSQSQPSRGDSFTSPQDFASQAGAVIAVPQASPTVQAVDSREAEPAREVKAPTPLVTDEPVQAQESEMSGPSVPTETARSRDDRASHNSILNEHNPEPNSRDQRESPHPSASDRRTPPVGDDQSSSANHQLAHSRDSEPSQEPESPLPEREAIPTTMASEFQGTAAAFATQLPMSGTDLMDYDMSSLGSHKQQQSQVSAVDAHDSEVDATPPSPAAEHRAEPRLGSQEPFSNIDVDMEDAGPVEKPSSPPAAQSSGPEHSAGRLQTEPFALAEPTIGATEYIKQEEPEPKEHVRSPSSSSSVQVVKEESRPKLRATSRHSSAPQDQAPVPGMSSAQEEALEPIAVKTEDNKPSYPSQRPGQQPKLLPIPQESQAEHAQSSASQQKVESIPEKSASQKPKTGTRGNARHEEPVKASITAKPLTRAAKSKLNNQSGLPKMPSFDPSLKMARAAIAETRGRRQSTEPAAAKRKQTSSPAATATTATTRMMTRAGSRGLKPSLSPPASAKPDISIQLARAAIRSPSRHTTPRASAAPADEEAAAVVEDPPATVASLKMEIGRELQFELPDHVVLNSLRSHVGKEVNVLAVATTSTTLAGAGAGADGKARHPSRTKLRQFAQSFNVLDVSTAPAVAEVQIFRSHQDSLPIVKPGDRVLLRDFLVVSLPKRGFALRSNEGSSYAVFDDEGEGNDGENEDGGGGGGMPQIRGPPVEVEDAEYRVAALLRQWWATFDANTRAKIQRENDKLAAAGAAAAKAASATAK